MKLQVQKIKTGEQTGNVRLAEDGKELAVLTKEQSEVYSRCFDCSNKVTRGQRLCLISGNELG